MNTIIEEIPSVKILGTRVDMIRMTDVIVEMARWIEEEPHQVHHFVNTGMHGIMEAHNDPKFGAILNSADLLAPDGILAILVVRPPVKFPVLVLMIPLVVWETSLLAAVMLD